MELLILIIYLVFFNQYKIKRAIPLLMVFIIVETFANQALEYYLNYKMYSFILGRMLIWIAFFLFFLKRNIFKKLISKGKHSLSILLFIIFFFLIAMLSKDGFIDSMKVFFAGTTFMTFYFFGLFWFKTNRDIIKFFRFFLLFYLINLIYGVYQQLVDLPEFIWANISQYDTLFNKGFGTYMGKLYYKIQGFSGMQYDFYYILSMFFVIIFASYNFFKNDRRLKKIIPIFLISYLVLLALSLERTPIMMLGILPLAYLTNTKKMLISSMIIIFLLIILTTYSFYFQDMGEERMIRFAQIANPLDESGSLTGRARTHWVSAFKIINNNPFGGGVESVGSGHNNFLMIFMQAGWFMGAFFIFIVVKCFSESYRIVKNKLVSSKYKTFGYSLLAAMTAMLLTGVVNIPFAYDCGMFFWLFLGLIENLPAIEKNESNKLLEIV